jgi:hypothetical protein
MRSISITRVYGSTGSSAAWTWEHPIAGDELRAIKRDIAMRTEALPLALHLRARAAAHAAIRELPRRRGSRPRWIAAGASAHAAPLLWIRAGQPRLRPTIDPRLPWPPRSQAHRPLHTCCRRALRGPLALSLSAFHAKAAKLFTVLERWAFLANNGDVTVALACEKALELFTPIDEREYVGYNGSLGRKGYDESVLAQVL